MPEDLTAVSQFFQENYRFIKGSLCMMKGIKSKENSALTAIGRRDGRRRKL